MTASPSGPERSSRRSPISVWLHLVRRFFQFLNAGGLTPREQAEISGVLREGEALIFWQQPMADQRHALDVAHRVLVSRPGDREAARAALLHDVGKRRVGLGALQRSFATVLAGLRIPLPGSYRAYLDHGPVGARELESVGAGQLAVAFARYHPGAAPADMDTEQWAALLEADHS